jgi:hypothetical protein
MDLLALRFTLLALHMSPRPIKTTLALSAEIAVALDSLPLADWVQFAEATSHKPRRARRYAPERLSVIKPDLPATATPRLACLLINSVSVAAAQMVHRRYLSSYDGEDPAVLAACLAVVGERSQKKPETWSSALPVIAHAYRFGVISGYTGGRTRNPRLHVVHSSADQCSGK